MNTRRYNRGFSLLELLIVVAIILIIATIAIPSLLRSRQAANETAAVANLRTVDTAETTYASSNSNYYGTVPQLISAGLLDSSFTNTKSGYSYTIGVTPDGLNYTAAATAVSPTMGRYDYYALPDYVIRFSSDATRAPANLAGQSVQ